LVDTKEEPKEKSERSKRGKASRAAGKRFEISVRRDCESRGYTVCKWSNTVIFDENGDGVLSIAKSKFNPFLKRVMSEGSGFPDYVCIKRLTRKEIFDILKEDKGKIIYPLSKRGEI
jgi:hypothetical protein